MSSNASYWNERYTSGSTPWDSGITPPEVEEFWNQNATLFDKSDLALDLGCGTLTNLVYLAKQNVKAIGIDLSLKALQKGSAKMVSCRAQGHNAAALVGSVTDLPLASGIFSYALDLGCLHTLEHKDRNQYIDDICRVLVPAGFYQMFGFQRVKAGPPPKDQRRYFLPGDLSELFDARFETIGEQIDTEVNEGRQGVWRLMRLL